MTLRNTHRSSNLPESLKVRLTCCRSVVALERGEEARFREQLEPVADADDELPVAHEPEKLVDEPVLASPLSADTAT